MSNDLGMDRSGNGNNWTVNNITYSDQVVDSPTNNFPTWDALRAQRPSLFEGNLLTETSTNTISRSVDSNFRPVSGKWYVEVYIKVDGANSGQNATFVGVANDGFVAGNEFKGHNNGVGYEMSGQKGVNNSMSSYGASYATGDIIGIAYDVDNDNITFYKNGVSQGELTSGFDLSNGRVVVATNSSSATGQRYHANFGQDSSFAGLKTAQGNQDGNDIGDFFYTPPTGFLALCTKNLPDVAVVPSEHFNTVLYTGNGGTNAITGVGFQPDFTWIKQRSNADSNVVFDAVRGVHKRLVTDSTASEADWTSVDKGLDVFSSDGFTVKDDSSGNYSVNKNSGTFVAWNWKANGSGSSNTDGSINSTVSANVDAGFSIATWTGSGSAGTIGHGLTKAPEMIITFARSIGDGHRTYHSGLTDPTEDYLKLDTTDAEIDGSFTSWNSTAPTSSVFSVAYDNSNNGSGRTYLAYCFHSVDGYSKVGSYTGNGNADGTFVYTGFRPAFIMVKSSSATGHWEIHDTTRDVSNVSVKRLFPNYSSAEDSDGAWDILSNGFKFRTTHSSINASGASQIYIAFAETPFKYSNAR